MSTEEETGKMEVVDGESKASEDILVSNVLKSYSMAVLPVEPNTTSSVSIQQPRQPTSLQDLLRYCVEAKGPGDNKDREVPGPIDPERAEFLMSALRSMMVNEVEEVMKALKTVREISSYVSEEELPTYVNALDVIAEFVHGIDVANDFSKYGGLEAMHKVLCVHHESLQVRAASIVGDCVQNNPASQRYALREPQLLPDLIKLIDTSPSSEVKLKALYAVSCIVRDNPCGVAVFHQYEGFEIVKKVLTANVEKLVIKAAYLVTALSGQDKKIQDHFVKLEFVQHLISLIEQVRVQSDKMFVLEALTVALHSLVNNNEKALEIIKSSNELKCGLPEVIKCIKGNEAYLELMRSAMDLLKICDVSVT